MKKNNRAAGWQHAKITGHKNEAKIEELLINDYEYKNMFLNKINKPNNSILKLAVGGINEKTVDCIFDNEKTTSKTDLAVVLDDNTLHNISIKKSVGGQVQLITIERFIKGYESHYQEKIPPVVKKGIELFWGSHPKTKQIIDSYGRNKEYEYAKNRLVADTLSKYDNNIYLSLISWFKDNIVFITDLIFSKGLARDSSNWASLIWYKNEIGENNLNSIFYISDIAKASYKFKDTICYGNRNGGTTIQLPFGFVQWHSPQKTIPGSIQFHHNHSKIFNIISDTN